MKTEVIKEKEVKDEITELSKPLRKKYVYECFKRIFDIVISIFALMILLIPSIVVSVFIYADEKAPVLYTPYRLGKNGKPFKIYKFRTMRANSDQLESMLSKEELEAFKQEFKLEKDPRLTRIGSFLRKTSIDEIPQFINVLIGNMSFVGPRPIVKKELDMYKGEEKKLLSIKPGLTGYWQAYARNQVGYKDKKRQQMELYYVDNRSLWLDVKIIFTTVARVLTQRGAM